MLVIFSGTRRRPGLPLWVRCPSLSSIPFHPKRGNVKCLYCYKGQEQSEFGSIQTRARLRERENVNDYILLSKKGKERK